MIAEWRQAARRWLPLRAELGPGHQSFANFNRVKGRLDEVRQNDAARSRHGACTISGERSCRRWRRDRSAYNPVTLDLLLGHQPSALEPGGAHYQSARKHQ